MRSFGLVGIARMAAQSPVLESKRRVEYRELVSRSYITRCSNPRLPFSWTINPYRGCEYACKYCYARYTHEFMELRDGVQFETEIFAKRFDPERFRRELRAIPRGDGIAIGTATDPYQPAERRYGVTRQMLEILAFEGSWSISIATKSDLPQRDRELLREVARRNRFQVCQTITTTDAALARLLEPLAPRPDLRLENVRALSEAGIRTAVFASPVMPLINDSEESLRAVAMASRAAGAQAFGARVLFLKPCAKAVFFPFLEERFPRLAAKYRRQFEDHDFLRGDYPRWIEERVDRIRAEAGFPPKTDLPAPELWQDDPQLPLFAA
jgi:DNA repair photolyase